MIKSTITCDECGTDVSRTDGPKTRLRITVVAELLKFRQKLPTPPLHFCSKACLLTWAAKKDEKDLDVQNRDTPTDGRP